jgi:hypothetical protein
MKREHAQGESKFGLEVVGSDSLVRALMEHGNGRWSICTFNKRVHEAFKTRPIEAECTFDMQQLIDTACLAFSSSPEIKDDRNAGKKLAAGVLMFATALGIVDLSKDAA